MTDAEYLCGRLVNQSCTENCHMRCRDVAMDVSHRDAGVSRASGLSQSACFIKYSLEEQSQGNVTYVCMFYSNLLDEL